MYLKKKPFETIAINFGDQVTGIVLATPYQYYLYLVFQPKVRVSERYTMPGHAKDTELYSHCTETSIAS